MPRSTRDPRTHTRLMAVLGLVAGLLAVASPAQAAAAAASRDAHHHSCKCGLDCGAACCCSTKAKTKTKSQAKQWPAKAPARTGRAPCIDASPCGGEGLPTSPPSAFRVPRAVAPDSRIRLRPPAPGERSDAANSALASGFAPMPPDEPPERRPDGA